VLVRPDPPFFTVAALRNTFVTATGLTRADVAGKGFFDVFPKEPGDLQRRAEISLKDSFEYVIRNRMPHEIPVQKGTMLAKGDVTLRYWRINNAPIVDDLGEVIYIIHSISDITETVEARQKLAAAGRIDAGYRFFMDACHHRICTRE
jgi:PAS domain S-box-containing protein